MEVLDRLLLAEQTNQAYECNSKTQFYSQKEVKMLLQKNWVEDPLITGNFDEVIEQYEKSTQFNWAIDCETTGLDYTVDSILGVGFSDGVIHFYLDIINAKKLIERMNRDAKVFLLHNAKFDRKFLLNHDIHLNMTHDTMLMAYVLGEPTKLSTLARKYLARNPYEYDELRIKFQEASAEDFLQALGNYCAEDCLETYQIFWKLGQMLKNHNLWAIYDIERRVEPVLTEMEINGIAIEHERLDFLTVEYNSLCRAYNSHFNLLVKKQFGKKVLITSPKQLRELFYQDLKLPTDGIKKTKQGHSTDRESLDILRYYNKIPECVFMYRLYRKALEFCGTLTKSARQNKIYTNFNQTITKTGRLSSSKPNVQNIPARGSIGKEFRSLFVPSFPSSFDSWIIAVDYSQFELRILAQLSQDEALLNAFRNNQDVHTIVTELIFGIVYEPDNPEHKALRRFTKTLNFGLIYGMSEFKLSAMAKVSIEEALDLIQAHKLLLGHTWDFFTLTKAKAVINFYSETLLGRKRFYEFSNKITDLSAKYAEYLPLFPQRVIGSLNRFFTAKDRANLRQAGNHPVQGTNADLIKLAMIHLQQQLCHKKYLGSLRMIMQIHDELVFEVSGSEFIEPCLTDIQKIMIDTPQKFLPDVPVKVSVGVGKNWGEAK